MNRRLLAVAGLILMIGLSGCATISISADVNDANTVDEYEINVTTSTTGYTFFESSIEEEGYSSVEDYAVEEFGTVAESVNYTEEFDGNDAHMSIRLTELNVSESPAISITEENGSLVYRDETFLDEEFDPETTDTTASFVVEYELEMPSEIESSNADSFEGNTATWRRTGEDAYRGFVVEAESPLPTDSPVPGFGLPAATIALAVAALIGVRKQA